MPKIGEVIPLSGPSGALMTPSAGLWSSRAGASDLGVSDDGAPSWLGALGLWGEPQQGLWPAWGLSPLGILGALGV